MMQQLYICNTSMVEMMGQDYKEAELVQVQVQERLIQHYSAGRESNLLTVEGKGSDLQVAEDRESDLWVSEGRESNLWTVEGRESNLWSKEGRE